MDDRRSDVDLTAIALVQEIRERRVSTPERARKPFYAGEPLSKHSTSAGTEIQGCAERVQICLWIFTQAGSSKVPAAIPRTPGRLSAVHETVVPQRGQNSRRSQRLLSSERCSYVTSGPPDICTCSILKMTGSEKALPVRRWQNVQWQTVASIGAPMAR
jgi:hypothetical protein